MARIIGEDEIGLVLCGGGARGAYQIGAWQVFNERGITDSITAVSGASVGALNSLLFVQEDFGAAEALWMKVTTKELRPPNISGFLGALGTIFGVKAVVDGLTYAGGAGFSCISPAAGAAVSGAIHGTAVSKIKASSGNILLKDLLAPGYIKSLMNVSLFTQDGLRKLIEENTDKEKVLGRRKDAYCVLSRIGYKISDVIPPKKNALFSEGDVISVEKKAPLHGEYFPWSGVEVDRIINYVMASAAYPVAYSLQEIDGIYYMDGGARDNIPMYPLVRSGYKKILVLHLDNTKDEYKKSEKKKAAMNLEGRKVIHIYPSEDLGKIFEISEELTQKRMDAGYRDVMKAFKSEEWF